jgi:hypothetical protein
MWHGFQHLFPVIVLVSVHFNHEINKSFSAVTCYTQNGLYLSLLGIQNVGTRLLAFLSLFFIFL